MLNFNQLVISGNRVTRWPRVAEHWTAVRVTAVDVSVQCLFFNFDLGIKNTSFKSNHDLFLNPNRVGFVSKPNQNISTVLWRGRNWKFNLNRQKRSALTYLWFCRNIKFWRHGFGIHNNAWCHGTQLLVLYSLWIYQWYLLTLEMRKSWTMRAILIFVLF